MIWWGTRRQEEGAGVTATQATVLDRTRPNKCDAAAVVFPWPPSQEGRGYNSVDYVVTQPAFTVEGNIFLFLQERNLCFYVGKIQFALLKEVHKLNVI